MRKTAWLLAAVMVSGAAVSLAGCGQKKQEDPRGKQIRGLRVTLQQSLKTSDRVAAAKELGEVGDERAIPLLSAALLDESTSVRNTAADALIRYGEKGMGGLLEALAAKEQGPRETAAGALAKLRSLKADADLIKRLDAAAIPALIKAMDSNAVATRVAVSGSLGSFPSPETIVALTQAMEDSEPGVRQSAILALGRLKDPRAAEELLKVLQKAMNGPVEDHKRPVKVAKDKDSKDKGKGPTSVKTEDRRTIMISACKEGLENLGSMAVEPLCKALASDDAMLAAVAAEMLGTIRDKKALPAIVERLKDAKAVALHQDLVATLVAMDGNTPDAAVAKALEVAMDSPDGAAGGAAMIHLADKQQRQITPKVVNLLKSRKFSVLVCINVLGRMKDPAAVELLVEILKDPKPYLADIPAKGKTVTADDLRGECAKSLGLIGDPRGAEPVLAELRTALATVVVTPSTQPGNRAKIDEGVRDLLEDYCHALGGMNFKPAIADLVRVAKLPYMWPPGHTMAAMGALASLADPAGLEGVTFNFAHFDSSTKSAACKAICKFRDPAAAKALVAYMRERYAKEDMSDLRPMAAEGLANMGAAAVEPLLASLDDPLATFRSSVVLVLARIGEPSLAPLMKKLDDANAVTRQAAAWALGNDQWKDAAKDKRDALSVAPLMAKAKDPVAAVRQSALWALGMIGKAEAYDTLVASLKDGESGPRRGAVEALGRLGDKRAVPLIAPFLDDAEHAMRQTASVALGRIGDPSGYEPLVKSGNAETDKLNAMLTRLIQDGKLLATGRPNSKKPLTPEELREMASYRDVREFFRNAMDEIENKSKQKAPSLAEVTKFQVEKN